jgi:hypothetical protein
MIAVLMGNDSGRRTFPAWSAFPEWWRLRLGLPMNAFVLRPAAASNWKE